jgi:hypothetical protein
MKLNRFGMAVGESWQREKSKGGITEKLKGRMLLFFQSACVGA